MKKFILLLHLAIGALFGLTGCSHYKYFKESLPIRQVNNLDEDHTKENIEIARHTTLEKFKEPNANEKIWLVEYPTRKGVKQKQKFEIDGNEVIIAGHNPSYFNIHRMIEGAAERTSSPSLRKKYLNLLGDYPIDTEANIIDYQAEKPSFLRDPEGHFFDLSVISTKLTILNSDRITYHESNSWKALVSDYYWNDSKGFVTDYFCRIGSIGLTIYFINRSENNFTLDEVRDFLSKIEIERANKAGDDNSE